MGRALTYRFLIVADIKSVSTLHVDWDAHGAGHALYILLLVARLTRPQS